MHKSNWCRVGVHETGNQAGGKDLHTDWLHVVLVLSERIPPDAKKIIKQHETWRYIYTLIALYISTVARILLMIQGLRVVHALMLLKIRKNEVMEIDRLLR